MTSPESPPFRNTICLHGPQKPTAQWLTDFASIDTSGASILLHTVEEADAFIKAACEAKDMLLAAQGPVPQCLTCGATETALETVHVRAREGIAARTEHYCRDTTACHGRRHPELASLVTHQEGRP